MKINILGVFVDNLSTKEVMEKIKEFLTDKKQHYIVTPNPEFLVAAQKDENFRKILNQADLAVPDGVGIILAAKILKKKIKERIPGVDLTLKICQLAALNHWKVFLLGGLNDSAFWASKKLQKKFPSLRIHFFSGGKIDLEGGGESDDLIIKTINQFQPQILFVAFGQVKQEKWIKKNLSRLSSVKLAMGVGGAFAYLGGKAKRPPYILRRLGLEWLWRLILEPWRIRRIFNATVVFLFKVILEKLRRNKKSALF